MLNIFLAIMKFQQIVSNNSGRVIPECWKTVGLQPALKRGSNLFPGIIASSYVINHNQYVFRKEDSITDLQCNDIYVWINYSKNFLKCSKSVAFFYCPILIHSQLSKEKGMNRSIVKYLEKYKNI